LVLSPKG